MSVGSYAPLKPLVLLYACCNSVRTNVGPTHRHVRQNLKLKKYSFPSQARAAHDDYIELT